MERSVFVSKDSVREEVVLKYKKHMKHLCLVFFGLVALMGLVGSIKGDSIFPMATGVAGFLYTKVPSFLIKFNGVSISGTFGITLSLVCGFAFVVLGILLYCVKSEYVYEKDNGINQNPHGCTATIIHFVLFFPYLLMVMASIIDPYTIIPYIDHYILSAVPALVFGGGSVFWIIKIVEGMKNGNYGWVMLCRYLSGLSIMLGVSAIGQTVIYTGVQKYVILPAYITSLLTPFSEKKTLGGWEAVGLIAILCVMGAVVAFFFGLNIFEKKISGIFALDPFMPVVALMIWNAPLNGAMSNVLVKYWLLVPVIAVMNYLIFKRDSRRLAWRSTVGMLVTSLLIHPLLFGFISLKDILTRKLTVMFGSLANGSYFEDVINFLGGEENPFSGIILLAAIALLYFAFFFKFKRSNGEDAFLINPIFPRNISLAFLVGVTCFGMGLIYGVVGWAAYICLVGGAIALFVGLTACLVMKCKKETKYYAIAIIATVVLTPVVGMFAKFIGAVVMFGTAFVVVALAILGAATHEDTASDLRWKQRMNKWTYQSNMFRIYEMEKDGVVSSGVALWMQQAQMDKLDEANAELERAIEELEKRQREDL